MRALILLALFASDVASCATPQSLPEKMRSELDKIDLKINLINHDLKKNLESAAELGNQIVKLRETVNAAKNPDNKARLEKALNKHELRAGELKETTDSQFVQIRDLKIKRALIVAPELAKYPRTRDSDKAAGKAFAETPSAVLDFYKDAISPEKKDESSNPGNEYNVEFRLKY